MTSPPTRWPIRPHVQDLARHLSAGLHAPPSPRRTGCSLCLFLMCHDSLILVRGKTAFTKAAAGVQMQRASHSTILDRNGPRLSIAQNVAPGHTLARKRNRAGSAAWAQR